MTLPAKILVAVIRLYQALLSPLLPPSCRYEPSCSRYAVGAVERFGAWRGLTLGIRRVLRCHPWSPGGFDPVPEARDEQRSVNTDDHIAHCEPETRTLHG